MKIRFSNHRHHCHRRRGSSLVHLLLLCLLTTLTSVAPAAFNYEIEKRVLERIDDFMNGPQLANSISAKFRTNGGFPNDMDSRDRDAYAKFSYTLMQEFKFDMMYVGFEDGTFIG